MFINAPTKEFTLTHLVTFRILRSRIRMKFYFVCRLIRLWTDCKIQVCYMSLYVQQLCNVIASSSINYNIKFTVHK